MRNLSYLLFLVLTFSQTAYSLSFDEQLKLVIDVYNLKPVTCNINKQLIDKRLTAVGEVVFNTPVLSGDKDTSCSTCHIDDLHLTDGLPISIGVGGKGEGAMRMLSDGVVVPRNSFTLFGRAADNYKVFFWDGKVHEFNGQIFSPIGEGYSLGFNSALAVAAVMPLLARDEFLGRQSITSSNEHLTSINEAYYQDKLIAANKMLRRVLNNKNDSDVQKLRQALKTAEVNEPDLPLIGNALASFIASKVSACTQSAWERYLSGQKDALSLEQKKGALVFFGKGRCAGCHSGSLFTDFKFHSIGAPQGEFGTHIHRQDIGRAGVTFLLEDRFKFRTPPLIYVSKTPPYGHNGTFKTLEEVVLFHINPIPFFYQNGWSSERELLTYGKLLTSRSDTLGFIDINRGEELSWLLSYLKSL
ncbi:MAG: His-Xaa-Ser system-associated MauG-like protein [Pseudomonadales bacterium]